MKSFIADARPIVGVEVRTFYDMSPRVVFGPVEVVSMVEHRLPVDAKKGFLYLTPPFFVLPVRHVYRLAGKHRRPVFSEDGLFDHVAAPIIGAGDPESGVGPPN